MTVRTAHDTGHDVTGVAIPVGIPVHVHMFSLHNSTHTWHRPKDFLPERWLHHPSEDDIVQDTKTNPHNIRIVQEQQKASRPMCPFATSASTSTLPPNHADNYQDYQGTGFAPESISFFPFSVGKRACPSSVFAVQLLRQTLQRVVTQYQLNVSDEKVMMEEDIGGSWSATIWPWSHVSMLVNVKNIGNTGAEDATVDAQDIETTLRERKGKNVQNAKKVQEEEEEDGWAQDEEDN